VSALADLIGEDERLVLRRMRREDQAEYLAVLERSAAFHAPWSPLPPADSDPFGPEAFARAFKADDGVHGVRGLLLVRDADALRLVGCVTLSAIVRGAFQSAFLGYWLAEGETGRGYMTDGIALLLDHAFRASDEGGLGLHRVEANVMPHNQASLAVVRRLGFRREGYSPRYLKIAGRWQDHERHALLSDEWVGAERWRSEAR